MRLNEQLKRLSDYKVGFNIYEGTIIISVVYPDKWTVLEPKNEKIQTTKDADRTYYWIGMDVNVDDIFQLIDETVAYNREIEEKAALFKAKIVEMQQVFIDNDLDSLRNLEFTLRKKTERKKPQTRKKKNKVSTGNEDTQEEKLQPSNEDVVDNQIVTELPRETESADSSIDDKIVKAMQEKGDE